MSIEEQETLNFLTELYNSTDGDTSRQASMYDIGAVLGLEKSSAGAVAEELIVDGYAELVTLSGGISITLNGLKELNIAPEESPEASFHTLGAEKILGEDGVKAVEEMLAIIKGCVTGNDASYQNLEEIVIDIKTVQLQLLSPKPKTEIIREILKSLNGCMSATGNTVVSDQIAAMTGS